jgi:hypothetical protein
MRIVGPKVGKFHITDLALVEGINRRVRKALNTASEIVPGVIINFGDVW